MIEIRELRKIYQMGEVQVQALRGVSLKIEPGEFVAIMGPSGSGKSTLLQILGLLDVPSSGSFRLFGQEVSKFREEELADLRAQSIGFIFQQFNLLARTTAYENVSLPLLYSSHHAEPERAKRLLGEVGLLDRILHKPNELSGGQQQRVAIARALINDPPIILADEPTGNLDSESEKEILKILKELNAQGKTVIIVTHEKEIGDHARRVIRMRDGTIQSDERFKPEYSPAPAAARNEAPQKKSKGFLSSLNPLETAQHFRQAFRALLANKVRSGLSLLGILIGVASLIAMLALGEGAKASIEAQLSSLGTNLLSLRPGSRRSQGVALESGAVTRLTMEDAKEILAGVPEVSRVSSSVDGRVQVTFGGQNWNTRVEGTSPTYAEMRAAQPVIGRFFNEEENKQRARVALLGQTVVQNLFGGASPLGEYIKINRVSFQVIGVLPEKGASTWRDQDDVIVIPVTTAMHRLLGKDYVDSIDIEVRSPDAMEGAEKAIQNLVVKRRRLPPSLQEEAFQIRNLAELQSALSETSRTMSVLLASIAAISLLVGGIGIMNIMLVSVTERTREIGLRKAVGAKRSDILAQFLIEAGVVSLIGGLLGITLGWTATWAMSRFAGWTAEVSPDAVLLAIGFSAAVGILFGLWPARKASRLHPIEALRYE
ncbi:MAG TPA: ABC transporter permease [bacterium]|nr:ABC transporter permease [bacterium]